MGYNKINDNEITGFTDDEFDIINCGEPEDIVRLANPNKVGHVVNKIKNKTVSDITPLIMIINASGQDWRDMTNALITHGADPDMEVEYYGKTTTAREIANKYRGGL
jgi:hypothetical protein